jgi:hypothetical protein
MDGTLNGNDRSASGWPERRMDRQTNDEIMKR